MAKGFQKGHNLSGSRKNIPNKTSIEIKEAFKQLVEGNLTNITKWMESVAEKDPASALEFMHKFAQFNVPLLARKEHVGDGGKPIEVRNWVIQAVSPDASK